MRQRLRGMVAGIFLCLAVDALWASQWIGAAIAMLCTVYLIFGERARGEG